MTDWIEAKVVAKRQLSPQHYSLQFEVDLLPFKAGQFIRLGLDIDGERVGRPYSLVNGPEERPYEILFNVVNEGQLTSDLAALEAGDRLWVMKSALGFLVLDEIPSVDDLWMMASGTGIGPFLSMLKTEDIWQQFSRVVLCHSVRYQVDLCYQQTIEALRSDHPGRLTYIPIVSRDQEPTVLQGRLPDKLQSGELEQRAGLTIAAENSHVLLCGNAGMIDSTLVMLQQRGMQRHRRKESGHISSERYF